MDIVLNNTYFQIFGWIIGVIAGLIAIFQFLHSEKESKWYIYKHYKNSTFKAVKDGWSWPAFFLNIFWAMYNKLWMLVISTSIIIIILDYIQQGAFQELRISQEGKIITQLVGIFVYWSIYGYMGNKWLKKGLTHRANHLNFDRYGLFKVVMASNTKEAFRKLEEQPEPSETWSKNHQPVIDLLEK